MVVPVVGMCLGLFKDRFQIRQGDGGEGSVAQQLLLDPTSTERF